MPRVRQLLRARGIQLSDRIVKPCAGLVRRAVEGVEVRKIMLALVVATSIPAIAATPTPCTRWSLNGYMIALTKDQAARIRPLGPADTGLEAASAASGIPVEAFTVELPDGSTGTVAFLAKSGGLISWTRPIEFSMHRQVLAQLRDTLGAPEVQALGSYVWVSRSCDARIELANDGERAWVSLMSYTAFKLQADRALR